MLNILVIQWFSYLQLIESGGGREMRKDLQMIRISFGDLGQLKKTKQGREGCEG